MSQRFTYHIRPSATPFAQTHTFSAKEKDSETGFSYFGSRYYSSDLSIWLSVDPQASKYPSLSPYVYCANNPIKLVDPDGEEGIVVTGSPGKTKMDQHFLINGLDRAKKAQKRTEKGESTTWMIYNDKKQGFDQELLDKYTSQAKEAGINVKIFSDVDGIIDYINNKNGGDSRSKDKISCFYYIGHATPGDLDVGYQGTGQNFDPSDLKGNAFRSGAWVNVVGGCRTAVDFTILAAMMRAHAQCYRTSVPAGTWGDSAAPFVAGGMVHAALVDQAADCLY